MNKIILTFLGAFISLLVSAQTNPKVEKHNREDSALKNAGATASQIQQFKAAKNLAITKTKQVKADSALTPLQKEEKIKQITSEKNNSYKTILGTDIYNAYNGFKRLKPEEQLLETSKPSETKFTKACLDSAGATSAQKQQFMATKREYKDKMKGLLKNASLTREQKKQQSKALQEEKNQKYLTILGQTKYTLYTQVKKRNQENQD